MSQPTVLLTGGSGVVGTAVLAALRPYRVVALRHRAVPAGADETVTGDLARPRLGLDAGAYADLARRVDVVVHAAGEVRFTASGDAAGVNARGCAAVTGFCADAGASLVHISTAFVGRERPRRAGGEAASPHEYLASKRSGDDIVRSAGVPHAIVRPSVVIGDSLTGRISSFQGLHAFAAGLLRGQVSFLPIDPDALLDVIPQDVVADGVRAVVAEALAGGLRGQEYWLTAGTGAPTVGRFVELVLGAGARAGIAVDPPRFVPYEMVDRLLRPAFFELFGSSARRRLDELIELVNLFGGHEDFPSSLGAIPGGPAPLPAGAVADAVLANAAHLITAKRLAPAAPVAA